MKITDISIKRPRAISMVFLAVIIFGFISVINLPINLFPDITFPMMLIMTSYPGAGPLEVENELTDPMEKMLGTVANLKNINSTTSENTSLIQLEFDWGTDLDAASNDVRDVLGVIQGYLPSGVDDPMIFKLDVSMQPVVMYNIIGKIGPLELQEISEEIADQLQRVGGVAASYSLGHAAREMQVILDPVKLKNTKITAEQIMGVLQAQNLNYPLGSVESGRNVYIMRLVGQYEDADEIRNTVVGSNNGIPIRLRQVGDVRFQAAEQKSIARTKGIPSIFGMVQKRTDANTVTVCNEVIKEIEEIAKDLPPGVNIEIMFNQARYITRSVRSTAETLVLGAILAIIILFLFLGNLRATLYVAVAIPITVFFALFAMYFFKMSLNILSLGGLTVAIGMVVDSAIVVFEAIYRHRQEGKKNAAEAASIGASEVGTAITASTFTTVAVFLPLLLVSGFASIFFKQLALTVTFALVSSLIVALTIIPMLTSRFLGVKSVNRERGAGKRFGNFYSKIEEIYGRIIEWALVHRLAIIVGTVIIFVLSLGLIPFIGAEFMPAVDQGEIWIDAKMPVGTKLAVTDSAVAKLEKMLIDAVPEAEVISTTIGSAEGFEALFASTEGPHSAVIEMWLVPNEERKRSQEEIEDAIRPFFNKIPGLDVRFSTQTFESFFGGAPIEIKIKGYDLTEAKQLSDKIIEKMQEVEGLTDLESSYQEGKPEFQILIDRQKAANFGLTPYQVGSILRTRIEGMVASKYRKGENEYDIKIRLAERYRNHLDKVRSMTITTAVGEVPLRNFVVDTVAVGPVTIEHENTDRVITIVGDVKGDLNVVAGKAQEKLKEVEIPADFEVEVSGGFEEMQTTFRDFFFVIALAVVLVYMIMVGQFESFKEPFVIMFTIPLALIGVLWMLFFTNTTLNLQSLLGILLLGGIVVNNAIVYITYTNQLRRQQGMPLFDAVVQAGKVRLKPILMTAFTTSFGLVPMALAIGAGNELRAPLARAVIGGLLLSTFLTLVFIPVLYTLFEKGKKEDSRE